MFSIGLQHFSTSETTNDSDILTIPKNNKQQMFDYFLQQFVQIIQVKMRSLWLEYALLRQV